MTFEPTIDFELLDDADTTTLRAEVHLREPTGGPHWWHVYQLLGDGMAATIVLKQGVPTPAELTPKAVLELSGIDTDSDDGADILASFDDAAVVLLGTFDRPPTDSEVAALTAPGIAAMEDSE